MIIAETYFQLMSDPAHLGAEATVTLIENIIGWTLIWLGVKDWFIKRIIQKHDEEYHNKEH